MPKYKYNNISTMRTFAESPAKWFMVDGVKMSRKDVETSPYFHVKNLVKRGKIKAIQKAQ